MEAMAPASRKLADRIAGRLRDHGYEAFLVGGCVRDLLLGIPPKDYDIATNAPPAALLELFPASIAIGAHFGVVLVKEDGAEVEVATYRTESAYEDGRHPVEVAFPADARADALRRDFTINALFLHPLSGEVIDYVGGRADLAARVIRTVGHPTERFAEDHLRMLRAVRFAARLGFRIDEETLDAIRQLRHTIRRVSAERIRGEMNRILTEGEAAQGLRLLDASGLLEEILPEVTAMKGVAQPPEFHPEGDVFTHTLLMLEALREPSVPLAWGVLLHDVGKPPTFRVAERIRFDGHVEVGARMAGAILRRLRFSHEEIQRVESLVAHHLRFKDVPRMRESTLKRFLRLEHFAEHLELHRLDCLSSHRNLATYEFVKRSWEQYSQKEIRPAPLLTGRHLIAAGYVPGPEFREMLTLAEDAQLEGRIQSTAEALELVRREKGPPHPPPASPAPPLE